MPYNDRPALTAGGASACSIRSATPGSTTASRDERWQSLKLSVVIAAYNEEDTIAEVIRAVAATPLDKEIIVVNDGSTDGTERAIESVRSYATHIHHKRVNAGKGAAIRTGLTYASGDVVVIQDADLELDPRQHATLVEPIRDGRTNVVYGSRFLADNVGVPRETVLANWLLARLTNILYGSRLTDMETAFKVFRRDLICSLPLTCERFEFEPEVTAKLLRLGEQILEVPIRYSPRSRTAGKKIRPSDGIVAIWTLLKWRVLPVGRTTTP